MPELPAVRDLDPQAARGSPGRGLIPRGAGDATATPRARGIAALSAFFSLAACVAGLTGVALLQPGPAWEPLWRLNPRAHAAFLALDGWAIVLMAGVAGACGLAARGLWLRAAWGRRIALAILAVNLAGNVAGALLRHDARMLIGLPVGGALIAYLLSPRVRAQF